MYKLCKTEQSAARQRELEMGLLKAMETERYEDISVSDLCDQMQIPRKSFYRYFSSKDGALHALLDHTLMEFEDYSLGLRGNTVWTVQMDLEQFFDFWYRRRELLDALARSGITGMLIERAVAYALTDDILPKRFLMTDDVHAQRQITTFCVCGMMSMVVTWHHEGFLLTAVEMARIATRILNQPLFPMAEK